MYTECIVVHILVNVLLTHFVYLNTKWLGGSKGKHSCKFDKFCQMISCRLLLIYNTPMNFTCLSIKQFETLWSLPISQWNMACHVNLISISLIKGDVIDLLMCIRTICISFSVNKLFILLPILFHWSIYIYISLPTCIYITSSGSLYIKKISILSANIYKLLHVTFLCVWYYAQLKNFI